MHRSKISTVASTVALTSADTPPKSEMLLLSGSLTTAGASALIPRCTCVLQWQQAGACSCLCPSARRTYLALWNNAKGLLTAHFREPPLTAGFLRNNLRPTAQVTGA